MIENRTISQLVATTDFSRLQIKEDRILKKTRDQLYLRNRAAIVGLITRMVVSWFIEKIKAS